MIYLRALKRTDASREDTYPLTVPLLRDLDRLTFDRPVTMLCGDNGSGKTTLMELLAMKLGAARVDVRHAEKKDWFDPAERAFAMEIVRRPRRSFFFQAEDFVRYLHDWFVQRDTDEYEDRKGQNEMLARYGVNLMEQSHGEGFLTFFGERIIRGGLYLLDEPEAALSPANQLVLLHLFMQAVAQDCQLIVSTHSPVLLAYPGARVYELRDGAAVATTYDDLPPIQFLRAFLNDTDGFIGRLTEKD